MSAALLYLDYAATAPLRPEAQLAWLRVAEAGGNASSVHAAGRRAKLELEDARTTLLSTLGAITAHCVFTAGGTEANAMALHQAYSDAACDTLIMGEGEHDSLYVAAASGPKPVVHAPLTPSGTVDVMALKDLMTPGAHVFVQLANNETGVIHDIAAIAAIVREAGGRLHVDAVQALGKMPIDFDALGADSLSLAAHKIGGPQGVGAFIARRDLTIKPLIRGGGQELGLRAGTENVAGVAAFAAALMAAAPLSPDMISAQTHLETALTALGVTIAGSESERVPGLICLTQPHWPSPQQLIHMDLAGICVSSGSACSSGKVKPSRILSAMGRSDMAGNVLRVSAGWRTAPEDYDRFFDVWSKGYEAFLKRRDKSAGVDISLIKEKV